MPTDKPRVISTIHLLCVFIILIWSFIHFLITQSPGTLLPSPTAFEWPAVDMMVYFERVLDPSFLNNDFFTNTSHMPSPRVIFGEFIIFMTKLFHTDYYTIFFSCKAFLEIFTPAVLYLFLCSIHTGFNNNTRQLLIYSSLLLPWALVAPTWWTTATFTVADWRPLPIWAAPQSVAFFLSLLAGILINNESQYRKITGLATLFVATLFHPSLGIFMAGFLIISAASLKQLLQILGGCCVAIGMAGIVLAIYFTSPFKLPSSEFVFHYVIEPYIHRSHYAPSSFGAYGAWPWQKVATMIVSLLVFGGIAAAILKRTRITYLAFIYAATYLASIQSQIFFIDTHPSRFFAIIGPIRYTQYGFIMLAIIMTCLLTLVAEKLLKLSEPFSRYFNGLMNLKVKEIILINRYISVIGLGLTLTLFSLLWIDHPKDLLKSHHVEMYDWINKNTTPTDTFAVPLSDSELFISIPIVAKRAVYYANAMAFIDMYMKENTIRKNYLYGSYTEWREGGPGSYYCNLLTGKRIIEASKAHPLSYVIMPNDCLRDGRFSQLKQVFSDNALTILRV